MTIIEAPRVGISSADVREQRRFARARRVVIRGRWRDSLEATAWLAAVGAVAFALASGTLDVSSLEAMLTTLGRLAGMAASTMIMLQLILIARVPVVERLVGHDKAARLHGKLGRLGFLVILAHIVLLTGGYALGLQATFAGQLWDFVVGFGTPMFLAAAGFVVLIAVVVTSYAVVRSRWQYENWHAVHLFSYVAVGLSIPHQFTDGTTYAPMGIAWWYWLSLWTVAVGSLLTYRVGRPLVHLARHRVMVASVDTLPDGSTVVTMAGRRLLALRPQAGQFFNFRFLQSDMWGESHPYSLSRAPRDGWMRITVKPLGDGSAALASLRVGTRVMTEGPLGTFTDATRSGDHLVLAGAGIGLTPILALLEAARFLPGECTVIVRASSLAEAPHLGEVLALAKDRGAAVHVLVGARGEGWAPAEHPTQLAALVPEIAGADVFACGPQRWVDAVFADAAQAGVAHSRLHREEFSW